jgi:hypothetical protein
MSMLGSPRASGRGYVFAAALTVMLGPARPGGQLVGEDRGTDARAGHPLHDRVGPAVPPGWIPDHDNEHHGRWPLGDGDVGVESRSSFSDIGLVVDQEPFIPMDRLDGARTAIFDTNLRGWSSCPRPGFTSAPSDH